MHHWRLLIQSGDKTGLVYRITGILYRYGCNVLVNHEFADPDTKRFFMRTEFVGEIDEPSVLTESRTLLPEDATIKLVKSGRPGIVVLASKEHHCLADLLIRHEYNELTADILAVISNHEQLGELVRKFNLPFFHVPVTSNDRSAHEQALLDLIEPFEPDYLVLAKYMRVLSPEFVEKFPARMINIHHSFLPAFIGARPYHQAFERGVKIIGATAHFVSNELDAGPIIVQEILPVDHTHSAQDLARAGRDVERRALSKALRLVLEDRVFLNGNRTVIFD